MAVPPSPLQRSCVLVLDGHDGLESTFNVPCSIVCPLMSCVTLCGFPSSGHHHTMDWVHHITSFKVHAIFASPPESSWDPRRYYSEGGSGLWRPHSDPVGSRRHRRTQ
eukprot:3026205-Pyramimonas_sp.AAC.1